MSSVSGSNPNVQHLQDLQTAQKAVEDRKTDLEGYKEESITLKNTVTSSKTSIDDLASTIEHNTQLTKTQKKQILKQLTQHQYSTESRSQKEKFKVQQKKYQKQLEKFGHTVDKKIKAAGKSAKKIEKLQSDSKFGQLLKTKDPHKKRMEALKLQGIVTHVQTQQLLQKGSLDRKVKKLQEEVKNVIQASEQQSKLLGEARTERKKLEKEIEKLKEDAKGLIKSDRKPTKRKIKELESEIGKLKELENSLIENKTFKTYIKQISDEKEGKQVKSSKYKENCDQLKTIKKSIEIQTSAINVDIATGGKKKGIRERLSTLFRTNTGQPQAVKKQEFVRRQTALPSPAAQKPGQQQQQAVRRQTAIPSTPSAADRQKLRQTAIPSTPSAADTQKPKQPQKRAVPRQTATPSAPSATDQQKLRQTPTSSTPSAADIEKPEQLQKRAEPPRVNFRLQAGNYISEPMDQQKAKNIAKELNEQNPSLSDRPIATVIRERYNPEKYHVLLPRKGCAKTYLNTPEGKQIVAEMLKNKGIDRNIASITVDVKENEMTIRFPDGHETYTTKIEEVKITQWARSGFVKIQHEYHTPSQAKKQSTPPFNTVKKSLTTNDGKTITRDVATNRKGFPNVKERDESIDIRENTVIADPKEIVKRLKTEREAAKNQQKNQKIHTGFQKIWNQLSSKRSSVKEKGPSKGKCHIGKRNILGKVTELYANYDVQNGAGLATTVGRRPTNEDAELSTTFTFTVGGQTYNADLTAVFDGHGGAKASRFAKDELVKHLNERLQKSTSKELTDTLVWNALKLALVDLSRSYEGMEDGTTGNIVLKINNDLWVANLGDSRALLVNDNTGETTQLSEDAKPAHKKYTKSIEARKGELWEEEGRVIRRDKTDSALAVARGIGDHMFAGAISARPKITKYTLDPKSSYHLVQACDGLFDVASSNQVGKVVTTLKSQDPQAIASTLVELAFQAGSMDNISALVKPIKATV